MKWLLFSLVFLLFAFPGVCASEFDYAKEAEKFDERIGTFAFVVGGLSSVPIDEGGEVEVVEFNASELKSVYREMTAALEERDLNLAKEKRNYIFNQIMQTAVSVGLNYSRSDVDRIVGPWSGYEIARLEAADQVPDPPVFTPRPTTTPVESHVPTETPSPVKTTVPEEEIVPSDQETVFFAGIVISIIAVLVGVLLRFRRKRKLMYCVLPLIGLMLLPYAEAGCVGEQCADITAIKVWLESDAELEDGSVLPAGTLICDSSVPYADGPGWNNKCDVYCENPDCDKEGFVDSFDFRTEVTVTNHGDTVINADRLRGMHRGGGYGCLSTTVRLLPGETKTFENNNPCRFRYNVHMDPGWYASRGSTGRSLYCFTAGTSHHYRCRTLMHKVGDSNKWAFVEPKPWPGHNNQSVLGSRGVKVTDPDPSNCPGNCVFAEVGETVRVEGQLTNKGVADAPCVKNMFQAYAAWNTNLNPATHACLPDYHYDRQIGDVRPKCEWDYDRIDVGETLYKEVEFTPVVPGHWDIRLNKFVHYEGDPETGACSERWDNVATWSARTTHRVYVRGPDAYLHNIYPPRFYFPPGEDYVEVETRFTVTTAYGTEAFDEDFPLLVDIYYSKSATTHMISSEVELDKDLSRETLSIVQKVPFEHALGVKTITGILKYDHTLPEIPGVPNKALMDEYMELSGVIGSVNQSCVHDRLEDYPAPCAYGYGALAMPVDFVKFIDFNEAFSDYYYFEDGVYYVEMMVNDVRDVVLELQNPFTQETQFAFNSTSDFITFRKGNPPEGVDVSIANMGAATSEAFFVDHNHYIRINPTETGEFDINISATAEGITDRARIHLTVYGKPEADFKAIPRTGLTPLYVDFYDRSKSYWDIEYWWWDFGDGTDSIYQNPSHAYGQEAFDSEGNVVPYDVNFWVMDNKGYSDYVVKPIYPYSVLNVNEVIAKDINVGDSPVVSAICNKDNVIGTLRISNYHTGEEIYSGDYMCNTGDANISTVIGEEGIYIARYRLSSPQCNRCFAEKHFLASRTAEIPASESHVIAFVCVLIALVFVLKRPRFA